MGAVLPDEPKALRISGLLPVGWLDALSNRFSLSFSDGIGAGVTPVMSCNTSPALLTLSVRLARVSARALLSVEHELVYLFTVAEADFGFGRVDVDIHGFGRQLEEKDESRCQCVVQYVAVCLLDGMEHDFVADKTMVDEAILFIGFAFGESRLGNRAIEPQRAIAAVNFKDAV